MLYSVDVCSNIPTIEKLEISTVT